MMSRKKSSSDIGKRIYSIRMENKLAQSEFAKNVGISQSHLSEVETGKGQISEKLILLIALQYRVSHDWLLTGKGEKTLQSEEQINFEETQRNFDPALPARRISEVSATMSRNLSHNVGPMALSRREASSLNTQNLLDKARRVLETKGIHCRALALVIESLFNAVSIEAGLRARLEKAEKRITELNDPDAKE